MRKMLVLLKGVGWFWILMRPLSLALCVLSGQLQEPPHNITKTPTARTRMVMRQAREMINKVTKVTWTTKCLIPVTMAKTTKNNLVSKIMEFVFKNFGDDFGTYCSHLALH